MMLTKLSKCLNLLIWWIRFISKTLILSISIPYNIFRHAGLFRHGRMDDTKYAAKIWDLHYKETYKFDSFENKKGFLELGPGDSLDSAFAAKQNGFNYAAMVDIGAFAVDSEKALQELNYNEDINSTNSTDGTCFNCDYFTEGELSLSSLPDAYFSFGFSNSVLQHIDKNRLYSVVNNLSRVTSKGGKQSHVIDFMDMINRSKLHLSCPSWIWESKAFKKLPIYTNRYSLNAWVELFEAVGFKILEVRPLDDHGQVLQSGIDEIDKGVIMSSAHVILEKR